MRVLILGSKEYPMGTGDDPIKSGGIEVYTQHLVRYLRGKVELVVITRKFGGTPSFEVLDGVEVYRVPWLRGFYLRNPTFNLMSFFRALTLDYDIVLSQGPVATLLGAMLSRLRGKRLVARPAGVAYTQPQYPPVLRRVLYHLERQAYRRADAVVFLSDAERCQFERKLGYLPERWRVIPTGVEAVEVSRDEVQELRRELGGGGALITFVGRLVGVKGVDLLISAVKDLEGDFKVLIVGDGPDRKKLESLAEGHGLRDRVVFTGWRSDVQAILAASDIFVLPSYSEGLPIALLEAMAAGKACVVTNIGLPVEDGKDALVVSPGDVNGLREALKKLLHSEDLRKKLGENARRRARRDFSWQRAAEAYLRLFRELS